MKHGQHVIRFITKKQRCGELTFEFRAAFQRDSRQLSVSLNLFVFRTRANYTQLVKSNRKIPKDSDGGVPHPFLSGMATG